jgi:hypothetical protein
MFISAVCLNSLAREADKKKEKEKGIFSVVLRVEYQEEGGVVYAPRFLKFPCFVH